MRHPQERGPVQVTLERGMLRLRRGNPQAEGLYDPDTTNALRAFFQAERDDALGRWRDPENVDMVCYPVAYDTDAVLVMYDGDRTRYYTTRSTWKDVTPYSVSETAGRYFAAHPEPKPWEGAKPGEVWALTYAGIEETAWVADFTWGAPPRFRQFKNLLNPIFTNDKHITAGRRIWPEGEASE